MNSNPNCGNDRCKLSTGQVRRVPTSDSGAIILCFSCYMYEMAWRIQENRRKDIACKYDIPLWADLEIYIGK